MRECSLIPLIDSNIVTKFELPKTKDLKLATFGFDFQCSYANHTSTFTTDCKINELLHEDWTICLTLSDTDTILQ